MAHARCASGAINDAADGPGMPLRCAQASKAGRCGCRPHHGPLAPWHACEPACLSRRYARTCGTRYQLATRVRPPACPMAPEQLPGSYPALGPIYLQHVQLRRAALELLQRLEAAAVRHLPGACGGGGGGPGGGGRGWSRGDSIDWVVGMVTCWTLMHGWRRLRVLLRALRV